jgi:hypothetical protein
LNFHFAKILKCFPVRLWQIMFIHYTNPCTNSLNIHYTTSCNGFQARFSQDNVRTNIFGTPFTKCGRTARGAEKPNGKQHVVVEARAGGGTGGLCARAGGKVPCLE